MFYPQNGDRVVAIDTVTSLHPMYNFDTLEVRLIKFILMIG